MNVTDAADVYKQTSSEFWAKISTLRLGTEFGMKIIVLRFLTKIRWLKYYTAGGKPWKIPQGSVGFVYW